jgi:hypothetical protein
MGLRTLADHIVDIAQNASDSGTSQAWLQIEEIEGQSLIFTIRDKGRGIPKNLQEAVLDPFYTEKVKKVKFGLGLPMLMFAAKATGGEFHLESEPGAGTCVSARFELNNVDCQPVGDIAMALFTIITMNQDVEWHMERSLGEDGYEFSSSQFKEAFGNNCFTVPVKMKLILEVLQDAEESLGG